MSAPAESLAEVRAEILIDRLGPLTRAAVVVDGRLTDLHVDSAVRPSRVGEVQLGRVQRIAAPLNAAYVELADSRPGFLGLADVRVPHLPGGRPPKQARLGTLLRPGQTVLVQIRAEAGGDKGPALSMDIAVPGRFLVATPLAEGIAVSKRIGGGAARAQIQGVITAATGSRDGWIARAGAADAPPALLAAEADHLDEVWHGIKRAAESGPVPRRLLPPPSAAVRALVEQGARPVSRILVEDSALAAELESWCAAAAPDLAGRIHRHAPPSPPLFERYDLDGEWRRLASPRVPIPGGGNLMIERTEALTAIDVNGAERPNLLAANLDAAAEIARQLRLRNIGGIVIVDFINLPRPPERQQVLDALAAAVADDPAATHVYGMSKLGLVEVTRARRGPPLADLLEPAAPSGETGSVPR